MNIKETLCKTALSPSTLPGLTYSLNPYRGCTHQCAYCYVPNVLRIPREQWGLNIEIKTNIPVVLAKELKTKKIGVVGISTVTDPYQPLEKKYELTRFCLEQLFQHDFPICIQTKSSLILRDLDLISRFTHAEVMISIGTLNEAERRMLEPNASSISERLQVLKECSQRGIKTSVFFGPIYPTLQIEDIPILLDTFIDHHVSEVMIDRLNLKPGIWGNINRYLANQPNLQRLFLKNIIQNKEYYPCIREEIKKIGREKSLTIIDAFP